MEIKVVINYVAEGTFPGVIDKVTKRKVQNVDVNPPEWITFEKLVQQLADPQQERNLLVQKQNDYQDKKQKMTAQIADLDAAIAALP